MHLHTYHPIELTDDVLSDAERQEAMIEFFRNSAAGISEPDLDPYLTRDELQQYRAAEQVEATQRSSCDMSETDGLLHIARLRRFACLKYNDGERRWRAAVAEKRCLITARI